jgi:hypothetical protein
LEEVVITGDLTLLVILSRRSAAKDPTVEIENVPARRTRILQLRGPSPSARLGMTN